MLKLFSDNSMSTAKSVQLPSGSVQTLNRSVGGRSDSQDFYTFRLSHRSRFKTVVNKLRSNVDLQLIFDRNDDRSFDDSEIVARSSNPLRQREKVVTVLDPGQYYLRVFPGEGGDYTSYTLRLRSKTLGGATLPTGSSTDSPPGGSSSGGTSFPFPSPSTTPTPTPKPSGSSLWDNPLPNYPVTSKYGDRTYWDGSQWVSGFHRGIDIGTGDEKPAIEAARNGTVSLAEYGWNGGYGNYIIIDHGDGLETRYAHLSQLSVKVGDRVDTNSIIGYVGSTGSSTGNHLHFEIRVNGEAKNPEDFMFFA